MTSGPETARVLVTTSWDDGHVLDERVAEMLAERGMAGTFYIAPHNRELQPSARLSGSQIRGIGARFEIGGHTLTHRRLPSLTDAEAAREITAGRSLLAEIVGSAPKAFAYPGGQCTPRHVEMVRRAGFTCARTVERWHMERHGNPFGLTTTVHAYRHWVDVPHCLSLHHGRLVRASTSFLNWDELAIQLFEAAKKDGGVWHLWGHSWEVEARGDWHRLARVLDHVAGDPEAKYLNNGELPFGESRV